MEGLQLQCFQATGTLNELYLSQLLKTLYYRARMSNTSINWDSH